VIDDSGRSGRPVGDYFRVIRRGWWIVLATVVVVTAVTYVISARQKPNFQATATDVISAPVFDPNQKTPASALQQYVSTQAVIAQSSQVAEDALKLVPNITDMTSRDLVKASTVTADTSATVVQFQVSYRTKAGAIALTNGYARAFAAYSQQQIHRELQHRIALAQQAYDALNQQVTAANQQIQTDKANGNTGALSQDYEIARRYQRKAEQAQETLINLKSSQDSNIGGSRLQSAAAEAAQLAPNTKRNTIVGFILGIVLGVGLVFAREAFDTRIRSAEEVANALGLPLFGRLPRPDKELRKSDRLALLADPHGTDSEAYRKLRVSLDFANLDPRAQMLLVTSAVAQEGKSTTAANLAVAMAGAGKRVILLDLDLRQPYLDRFFGLTGRPGLTDVILGTAELDDALAPVVVPGGVEPQPRGNGHGPTHSGALLHVLVAGDPPADPSSLLVSQPLAALLTELRSRADMIVIDTPPVLPVADTMGLTSLADGYLVVSRLDLVRRPMVHELRRELASARAVGLGVVVTDAEAESGYGYGGAYGGYSYGAPADQPTRAPADR
jgi:Mrp family chromosome partitioning ATPase